AAQDPDLSTALPADNADSVYSRRSHTLQSCIQWIVRMHLAAARQLQEVCFGGTWRLHRLLHGPWFQLVERRRHQKTILPGKGLVDLDATFYPTRFYLGLAYRHVGQFEKAVAELEHAWTLSKESTLMSASPAGAFAAWGKIEQARRILGALEQR